MLIIKTIDVSRFHFCIFLLIIPVRGRAEDHTLNPLKSIDGFNCLKEHTCYASPTLCKCDEKCLVFGDCCLGINPDWSELQQFHDRLQCHHIAWLGSIANGLQYYMISKCPANWEDDIVKVKCEQDKENDFLDRIPVSSNRTFLTYRNKFCALCNSLDNSETITWTFEIECKSFATARNISIQKLFQSYINNKDCDVVYSVSGVHKYRRACISNVPLYVETCPQSYKGILRESCNRYLSPMTVYEDGVLYKHYRNINCFLCNSNKSFEMDNSSHQFKGKCWGLLAYYVPMKRNRNLPLMFRTHDAEYELTTFAAQKQFNCREHEIQINSLMICVDLLCPAGSMAYFGMCRQFAPETNSAITDIFFYINGSINTDKAKNFIKAKLDSCIDIRLLDIKVKTGSHINSNSTCIIVKANIEFKTLTFGPPIHISQQKCLMNLNFKVWENDVLIKPIYDITSPPCNVEKTFLQTEVYYPFTSEFSIGITCPSLNVHVRIAAGNKKSNSPEEAFEDIPIYFIGNITINSEHVEKTSFNKYFICYHLFEKHYEGESKAASHGILRRTTTTCLRELCIFMNFINLVLLSNRL